jgi:hypothetical protein
MLANIITLLIVIAMPIAACLATKAGRHALRDYFNPPAR